LKRTKNSSNSSADAPPEAALQKLFGSEIQQRTCELAMALLGPYGALDVAAWQEAYIY